MNESSPTFAQGTHLINVYVTYSVRVLRIFSRTGVAGMLQYVQCSQYAPNDYRYSRDYANQYDFFLGGDIILAFSNVVRQHGATRPNLYQTGHCQIVSGFPFVCGDRVERNYN